jgi:hypothetical protein
MTALVGGSVLLIVVAATALVLGWTSADGSLIWTSIGASVTAAVLLALGYYRSRAELDTAPPTHPGPPAAEPPEEPEPQEPPEASEPQEPSAPATRPSVPSTDGGIEGRNVVADPDRKRYHRPECRFARASRAQPMSLDAARARRYDPCGVCKPDER